MDLTPGQEVASWPSPPRNVVPDRVSLPARAGCCKPEDHLTGDKLRQYSQLENLVLEPGLWEAPLPRPCHMCSPSDESVLRRTLVESGMAEIIP